MKTCDAKTMMPGLALVVMGLCCSAYADSDCENSAAFTIDNATVQFADVIGRVVEDSGGNPPVAGATVVLSPGGHVTTTLGDGTLEFQDVPIATGYGLEIVAEGYESVTISPVDVLLGVNDLGDILLTPLTGTFSLQPLSPAIHDGASQVEEGCLAYRYFRVVRDDTDQPQGGVRIRVRPVGGSFVDQATYAVQAGYAGATPGLSDGGSGAVRLCIPASEVGGSGSAQTFETVLPDESSGPSFEVSVVSRRYEHGWSQQAGKGINVGVNVVGEGTLGVEQGYLGSIARQSGGEGDPEQVSNGSSTRLTFEVGVGAPVGGSAKILGAKFGATASGGVGLYAELDTQFAYGFDTVAPPNADAALQRLYCLYASAPELVAGPGFSTVISLIRSWIEQQLLGDTWRWSEGGFEVGGYGTVEGILGIIVGKEFALGGTLEADGEIGGRFRTRYDKPGDRWIAQAGLAMRGSADVGIGIGFRPYAGTGRPAAFKTIMNNLGIGISTGGWFGVEQLFEVEIPDGANRADYTRLITRAGGTLAWWDPVADLVGNPDPNERDVVVEIAVTQPISSSQEWQRAASLPGMVDLLSGAGGPLVNAAFGDNVITGLFGDYHYAKDMTYCFSAELSDPWQADVGIEGTLILKLGIHFNAGVARTRSFELERGVIRGGCLFPLQSTPGANGIPSNTESIIDIQGAWVNVAAGWFEEQVWNFFEWIFGGGRSDDLIQLTTTTGSAELLVPSGTFAVGTTMGIDSWADEAVTTNGWMYGVGGMYRFEADSEPTGSMTLKIEYLDSTIVGLSEAELRVYRHDVSAERWQLVGGIVDVNSNAVSVDIDTNGLYTIAPPLPAGAIAFQLSATMLPADGTSTVVAQAENLLLNTGAVVDDGWLYTVQVEGMDIVTEDVYPDLAGVQVVSSNGQVSVEFQAPEQGGIGIFSLKSILGDAAGSSMIAFEDDAAPPEVTGLQLVGGQSRVQVSWDASGMPADVARYLVYYSQDHVPPPFDGTSQVEGAPSPVHVAGSSWVLRGLTEGSEYHVAVSAVDVSGNEGLLSTVMTATTAEAPPTPPVGVSAAAADGERYEVSWALSEDDGFNDRDVHHYEVFRWVVPGEIGVKVADVAAGLSAYIDDTSALPPQAFVMYEVAAVDTAGLSSERVGLPFDPDGDQDGDVDLDDYLAFADCLGGPMVVPASVPECLDGFDTDGDGDVDMADFQVFQLIFGG